MLVVTFCANIHCNSKEPQLVVGEAVKRWQGGFARHLGGGETALDGRWWTPRLLLANKVEAKLREGVQTKKTFLNGHCPDRSDRPPPRGATGNVVLFFGRQKRHLSAYCGIKFQLKMTVKMMNMMMKMVIILMFDDYNAQKYSTTLTLWSKYTSFK